MSYNINELPRYMNTAGKITVITALLGVVVFAVVFLLNIGVKEINQAVAQSNGLATTTVTVLNTPPQWTVAAEEVSESSTSTPTNSGSVMSWHATATDSNAEDYYLLICSGTSTPAPPTANAGSEPTCAAGQVQWAVSPLASSGEEAVAATTTIDKATASSFAERNVWFAWICDAVAINPRCNATYEQGSGSTASPFHVNNRPLFTVYSDDSPALPGQNVIFSSTASDTDAIGPSDTVRLWVCTTDSFNSTSSIGCNAGTYASSTLFAQNPTSSYQVFTPTPDTNYGAYGFIVDSHGHTATGSPQGTDSVLTVLNATPTIAAAQIVLNDGNDIVLTGNATQTQGFTVQFTVQDDNSCERFDAADEITDYRLSVFRSAIGSSTCTGTTTSAYDANNCYTTGEPFSTWQASCTASSTSCTYDGNVDFDDEQVWDCTFPLWFVADPTDGGSATTSPYFNQDWRAAVAAVDDDNATSTFVQSSTGDIDVRSFLYFSLDTLSIPYGSLEPGQYSSPTITASTTIRSEGNIGIDEELIGTPMCSISVFTTASTCPNSSTSTIPAAEQVYATSSVSYGTASTAGNVLSSTTQTLFNINVLKPTNTATTTSGVTYWGINIPSSIVLAGDYTGENTFYGAASDASTGDWY